MSMIHRVGFGQIIFPHIDYRGRLLQGLGLDNVVVFVGAFDIVDDETVQQNGVGTFRGGI